MKEFRLKNKFLLYMAMVIPFFCGFGGVIPNIVTLAELVIALYFFNCDDFYLLTPIMCIYYSQLLLIGNSIGGYNLFMWLCVLRMIIGRVIYKDEIRPIVGLFLLFVFAAVVMLIWQGIWHGFSFLILGIGTLQVARKIRNNTHLKKIFITVFIGMCMSAALYGIVFVNIKGEYEQTAELIYYTGRYCGTMSDPNYMSFFYCLSVAYIAFSERISLAKKILLIIFFICAVALSGSLTALTTIFIILLLYIWLGERNNRRQKIYATVFIIFIAVALYYFLFTDMFDIKLFTVFRDRLAEKLILFGNKNYSAATSGRTEYSQAYINYLFNQNIFRILFGGYQLNSAGLMGEAYNQIHFAAHNSYVDVLMTCGLVGVGVFIYHLISNIVFYFRKWRYEKDNQSLSDAVALMISAVFLLGLSCFPSTCYLLFVMI